MIEINIEDIKMCQLKNPPIYGKYTIKNKTDFEVNFHYKSVNSIYNNVCRI